jgi:short-subunit dehydrogenase
MKTIAIVTGATSGVGREFVRQLDGTYYGKLDEIWAVARDARELDAVASQTYAPTRPFALDLTDPAAVPALAAALEAEDVRVLWLVNAAGMGRFEPFSATPAADLRAMVELNCLALTDLTSAALPHMAAGSRIVNLASVAAYMPFPSMGVYAATKRYVLDLTRALNAELSGCDIHACAVCPKAMRTSFWEEAGSEADLGFFFGTEKVFDVVRKAIAAVNAGHGAIVTSPEMKLVCGALKVLPYGVDELIYTVGARALRARQHAARD